MQPCEARAGQGCLPVDKGPRLDQLRQRGLEILSSQTVQRQRNGGAAEFNRGEKAPSTGSSG